MKKKIGKLFKTINKKQARIISVVFGLATIALIYDMIKDINSGLKLGDLKYSLLLTVAVILIEFSMLTIAFSKDEDAAEKEDEQPKKLDSGEDQEDISEEFNEGLSEEFEGCNGSEGGEFSGSEGGFGGDADGGAGGDAG